MAKQRPSYKQGYARYTHEVAPEARAMRESAVGLWYPSLGITGATLRDVSGHGSHGAVQNATWVKQWLNFDATVPSDRVFIGAPATMDALQEITLSMLVYFDADVGDYDLVVKGSHGANQPFVLWYDATDKYQFLITDEGGEYSGVKTSATTPAIGVWQHLALTFANEQARMFIDGVEDGNSPWTLTGVDDIATGSNWWVGTSQSLSNFLKGRITNLSIHNKGHSISEIRLLSEDPGILVRKHRRQLPVSSGVVPAVGDIPIFMHHYMHNIG